MNTWLDLSAAVSLWPLSVGMTECLKQSSLKPYSDSNSGGVGQQAVGLLGGPRIDGQKVHKKAIM